MRITLSKPKVKTVERRDLEGRPFRAGEKNTCQRWGREKVIHTHTHTDTREHCLWEETAARSGKRTSLVGVNEIGTHLSVFWKSRNFHKEQVTYKEKKQKMVQ